MPLSEVRVYKFIGIKRRLSSAKTVLIVPVAQAYAYPVCSFLC